MGQSSTKAQTTFDYFILMTAVLIVIVPLLFVSAERLAESEEQVCSNDYQLSCEVHDDCPETYYCVTNCCIPTTDT